VTIASDVVALWLSPDRSAAIFQTGDLPDAPWTMGPVWRWEIGSSDAPSMLTELGTLVRDQGSSSEPSDDPSVLVEGPPVHQPPPIETPSADTCWPPNGRLSWLGDDGRPEAVFAERAVFVAGHRVSRRVVIEWIGADDLRESTLAFPAEPGRAAVVLATLPPPTWHVGGCITQVLRPAWSPDGRHLVTRRGEVSDNGRAQPEIGLVSAEAGQGAGSTILSAPCPEWPSARPLASDVGALCVNGGDLLRISYDGRADVVDTGLVTAPEPIDDNRWVYASGADATAPAAIRLLRLGNGPSATTVGEGFLSPFGATLERHWLWFASCKGADPAYPDCAFSLADPDTASVVGVPSRPIGVLGAGRAVVYLSGEESLLGAWPFR